MNYRIKYPKFLALVLSFVAAYFLFQYLNIFGLNKTFASMGYLGVLITGIFFSYGFTAAPATALFLILADSQNFFTSVLIGASGACLGDFCIFSLVKTGFKDELVKFEKEKIVRKIDQEIPLKIRHYLLLIFAELMIVSPLPNEIGISMLAMDHHMTKKKFIGISFLLSAIGIAIILLIGRVV